MTEEMSQALSEMYFVDLNMKVLPKVDFDKLAASYQTENKTYAKQVLHALHAAFVKRYGSEYATEENCGGFVTVPAVIRSKYSSEMCIGMVSLDLSSSCEHCGTQFFTERGILMQGQEHEPELRDRIDDFFPYDYWYTVKTTNDIHIDRRKMPPEIGLMIDEARTMQTPEKVKKPKHHEK